MAKRAGVDFFVMKILVDFFSDDMTNITDPNALTATEQPVVTKYARNAYMKFSLLLCCDLS